MVEIFLHQSLESVIVLHLKYASCAHEKNFLRTPAKIPTHSSKFLMKIKNKLVYFVFRSISRTFAPDFKKH